MPDYTHQDFVRRKLFLKLAPKEGQKLLKGLIPSPDHSNWELVQDNNQFSLIDKSSGEVHYYFDLEVFPYGYKSDYFFVGKPHIHQDAYIDRNQVRYFIEYDLLGHKILPPCLVTSNNFLGATAAQELATRYARRSDSEQVWLSGVIISWELKNQGLENEYQLLWKDLGGTACTVPLYIDTREDSGQLAFQAARQKIKTRSNFRALVSVGEGGLIVDYME